MADQAVALVFTWKHGARSMESVFLRRPPGDNLLEAVGFLPRFLASFFLFLPLFLSLKP